MVGTPNILFQFSVEAESLPLGRSQGSVSFGMDLEKSGVDRGLGGREREPTEQRCGLY